MKRKIVRIALLATTAFLPAGCSRAEPHPVKIESHTIIDWVDFVNLNGYKYTGLWGVVPASAAIITDQIAGEIKFSVASVMTDPYYQTRSGDAAFLEKGTKLYEVKGYKAEELLAVKDERYISGYRLYGEDQFQGNLYKTYSEIAKDKITRIELYQVGSVKPYRTLEGGEQEELIKLLNSSTEAPGYQSSNRQADPLSYRMVFYTDESLANTVHLEDDGEKVYFTSGVIRTADPEIRTWLQKPKEG